MPKENFVIVESIGASQHYLNGKSGNADETFLTTSPSVFEHLRASGSRVLFMDADLTLNEADRVGYAAIHAANSISESLNQNSDSLGVSRVGDALKADIQRLVCCLLYKARIFDPWVAKSQGNLVNVGHADLTPVKGLTTGLGRFDTVFTLFAAHHGLEIIPHVAEIPKCAQPNGDFLQVTSWTRFITMINMPLPVVFFRILKRFRRWAQPTSKKPIVGIFSSNELIEETALALSREGAFVTFAPAGMMGSDQSNDRQSEGVARSLKIDEAIKEGVHKAKLGWTASMDPIPGVVTERLGAALGYVPAALERAKGYVNSCEKLMIKGPFGVVANFISSPADILLSDVLKSENIPVFVFDHGVGPGLDWHHKAYFDAGFSPVADIPISHNSVQHKVMADVRGDHIDHGLVAGAPSILRKIGFREIQRSLVRRHLGIEDKLLCWVSGLYPNNMQRQPHYYLDGPYHELRREIVYDVLGKAPYDVLFKLYPTLRYIDGDPFANKMELPANCRSEMLIDFRNFRAASDVTIIDEPGSGVAWCWGLDRPLIYLDTQVRLLPEVARAFSEAIFYVDTEQKDWKSELLSLVTMPYDELASAYRDKAKIREEIAHDYIFGPGGKPGARAANYITQTIAECSTMSGTL